MPIIERDAWREQYFEQVACPPNVMIPTDDERGGGDPRIANRPAAPRGGPVPLGLCYNKAFVRSVAERCAVPVPWNNLRFVRVLQQLDLTHDIYGMSGAEIVRILPTEFEA